MTAIQLVKAGDLVYNVSKSSGIPYGTLCKRTHDHQIQGNDKRIGSGCGFVLSNTEEKLLVESLMYLADEGFPQFREDIKLMLKSFITLTSKNNPFKDDKPGKDWCISFEKRWSVVLGKRKPKLFFRSYCRKNLCSKYIKKQRIIVIYKAFHLYDAWCQNGPKNTMYGVIKLSWMEDYLFESWIDRFIIHVKDYEKPVLLL